MSDGRFKKGHPGGPGRPKGSRNKIAESFLNDMLDIWEREGKAALEQMREEDNTQFVKTVASLLPKDYNLNVNNLDELSIAELEQRARNLGNALGLLGDIERAQAEERPHTPH